MKARGITYVDFYSMARANWINTKKWVNCCDSMLFQATQAFLFIYISQKKLFQFGVSFIRHQKWDNYTGMWINSLAEDRYGNKIDLLLGFDTNQKFGVL